MTDPYCQHAECHSHYTAQYAGVWTSSSATLLPQHPSILGVLGEHTHLPNHRRWCRAHALIFEGVAFG